VVAIEGNIPLVAISVMGDTEGAVGGIFFARWKRP
jgi:hypothetical protein